ncbi:hypothetical protein [Heliorestis convoluta]|uniref:Uncharacterized protein n=1 Tax=Heliorestis convoluta TaxID=356322 RepID=A0A5Q2N081_9FIRM|nr:hypothetical protein [Heliorestis convoluta]QGG47681.1 hypothetical protein FTV88_1581 [Heliorestis convoluta]
MSSANAYDRYRMDGRTLEQFAKDIEKAARVERDIIELYVAYYERTYNKRPVIEDNGCDNSGQLLSRKKVSTKADFKVNGKLVEVKYNNEWLKKFRFKADQLNSYLKQDASVLWVNGYTTKTPKFTVLKTKDMETIKATKTPIPFIPWGGKKCYELQSDDYVWTELGGRNERKCA